ncbi:adenosylcobinamide-GDP ribazoletransferase [Parabacteroides sp. PF5-6]|uniref:adenosylcobinamide-GDP ribazoletransferase n=1 Tax=Parabacteroides sp. PF5-6 TaxID=1742403 RepID=UPI002406EE3C|nr:adenosylcobinamide-GDP ribazoletransferase [Parabacteroides sp. PF5-6]MDF9831097.1 adenosylcobinamide-GDP ribazoletransferase [Parabacteroides sp. PF5-6]
MKQVLAALIFFTRLPFWRLAEVPAEHFKRVVPYWPLTGWLTAACSVGVLFLAAQVLPGNIPLLLAILTRLLITGCLHEDGLADFLDGFGGGTSRERILTIMKDSHIGTYGVIGLIVYFLFYFHLLASMPIECIVIALLVGEPFAKMMAGMIINRLPYARQEEDAKIKTVYSPMNWKEYGIILFFGCLPLCILVEGYLFAAILFPVITFFILTAFMKKKIGGYTGDCCGATFLLCELSFLFGFTLILHSSF